MHLETSRGDTIAFTVRVFADEHGHAPFDLTGAKVWSTLKVQLSDTDAAALSQVSTAGPPPGPGVPGGVVVTDAPNGRVLVQHPQSATLGLPAAVQRLYVDVQVLDALGRTWTVDWGTVTVEPDVTVTQQ